MKENEKRIIELLELLEPLDDEDDDDLVLLEKYSSELSNLLGALRDAPFGTASEEFISNPQFVSYAFSYVSHDAEMAPWLAVEYYLRSEAAKEAKQKTPKYIEDITKGLDPLELLKTVFKDLMADKFKLKTQRALNHPNFIRNVYLAANEKLCAFFMEKFPIPRAEIFDGYPLPALVADREKKSSLPLLKFLGKDPDKGEALVKKMQRHFRGKKRQREEEKRVTELYGRYLADAKLTAKELLNLSDKPYFPTGCDKRLAERIFNAASTVKLFSTIRHVTSASALTSIMNEGLYGRDTLQKLTMTYKPAALGVTDILDGDLNAICFGPYEVDSKLAHSDRVELVLEVGKIKDNPCIFYKQRDFGYFNDEKRVVDCGEDKLVFSHTSRYSWGHPNFSYLQLYRSPHSSEPYAVGEVPKPGLIAYDFKKMHQILILNFFKFLDNLKECGVSGVRRGEKFSSEINKIYSQIARFDDHQLVSFLETLGKKMVDTAEFNFYGAYQIDFPALNTIRVGSGESSYALHMPSFISSLQSGDVSKLKEAAVKLPQLFQSYRFIDYLSSQIDHAVVKAELQAYRNHCKVPAWREPKATSAGPGPGSGEEFKGPKPRGKV